MMPAAPRISAGAAISWRSDDLPVADMRFARPKSRERRQLEQERTDDIKRDAAEAAEAEDSRRRGMGQKGGQKVVELGERVRSRQQREAANQQFAQAGR